MRDGKLEFESHAVNPNPANANLLFWSDFPELRLIKGENKVPYNGSPRFGILCVRNCLN